jgi:hypothetical protein
LAWSWEALRVEVRQAAAGLANLIEDAHGVGIPPYFEIFTSLFFVHQLKVDA